MADTNRENQSDILRVGIAQIAPVWLDRELTINKAVAHVERAACKGCRLVAFGEALVPGYPFWIERTDLDLILANSSGFLANGGSCIAGPDGQWVVEPVVEEEKLIVADIDHRQVRGERQNFDPAGHYARPDVARLVVDRKRQSVLTLVGQAASD